MEELGSDLLYPFPEETAAKSQAPNFIPLDRLDRQQLLGDLAQLLVDGAMMVYPTDTVYGLGVVPLKPQQFDKVADLKQRSPQQPLSLLVSDPDSIYQWATVPDAAKTLIQKFWPGPLTIVLEANSNCPPYWRNGQKEVAFRHIESPHMNALVEAVGGVITTTSANISGHPAARTVQDAYRTFEDKVDIYLDGGEIQGAPSTIVRITKDGQATILREGTLTQDQINEALTGG